MKKIIYISNANIPSNSASSVHVMKMCEAFKKNGVDISLILPNHYDHKRYKSDDAFEVYGIKEKFPIKRIRCIQKNVKGIREIIYTIMAVLYSCFKRPDAIMTRKIMAARVASMIGLPYVLELHTATEPTHYSLSKTIRSKHMIKLVVISEALKNYIVEKYAIDPQNIMVLPDAVNIEEYQKLDTSLELNEDCLRVAYVGSLFPGKGIETIVRLAAEDVKNRYDIYGARGPIEKWKKLAGDIGSKVNFMGQIDNAKVPKTLVSYDVLLMPYSNMVEVYGEDLTNWMSPLKMFEYMASGRVIVASDLPVIKELLEDQVNALLVESDNVDAWKNAIHFIDKNRDTAKEIAAQAKEDVAEYTWYNRAHKILQQI